MAFRYKKNFSLPPDDALIWRYMDLTKFLSILDKKSLFFPTIALLRKLDPWEGSWSNFEAKEYVGGTEESKRSVYEFMNPMMSSASSRKLAVSCWHLSEYESTAMWKLYLMSNEGIAVQTTFGTLKQCFMFGHRNWPKCGGNFKSKEVDLIPGEVEYIDWNNPPVNTDMLRVALLKGKSLEFEREMRIIAELFPIPGWPVDKSRKLSDDSMYGLSRTVVRQVKEYEGVYFPVDIKKLITNIYIVPTAAQWFVDLVNKITKRYGLNATIHWSNKVPRY